MSRLTGSLVRQALHRRWRLRRRRSPPGGKYAGTLIGDGPRIHRSLEKRLSTSTSSHHDLSLVAFITNTAESDFRYTQVRPLGTSWQRGVRPRPKPTAGLSRESRCPNEVWHGALASHFRLLELGSSNRPVESGAQLLGRLQRQLNPSPRTRFEGNVDEVERDDVAQRRMACVVIRNHRLREREPFVPPLAIPSARAISIMDVHMFELPISPVACRRRRTPYSSHPWPARAGRVAGANRKCRGRHRRSGRTRAFCRAS